MERSCCLIVLDIALLYPLRRPAPCPCRITPHRGGFVTARPQQLLVSLLTALIASGIAPARPAQPHDTSLQGVWQFVEEVDHRADGSIIQTGPAAGYSELLIFTSSGYMSSTIMPKRRTWSRETVTSSELRET